MKAEGIKGRGSIKEVREASCGRSAGNKMQWRHVWSKPRVDALWHNEEMSLRTFLEVYSGHSFIFAKYRNRKSSI